MARVFTDQIGCSLSLETTPQRIVSVVPSQTELLWYLGLEDETVGITKFCIHPNTWFKQKRRIGGTKTLDIEAIKGLNPDLIIANKEENQEDQIKTLKNQFPTYVSDIFTLEDNLAMIRDISGICDRSRQGNELIEQISSGFSSLDASPKGKVLYLIWHDPMMAVGRQTYIHHMLSLCGFDNALPDQAEYERYPQVTDLMIETISPDFVFLSSEPFPFKEKHLAEYQKKFPNAQICLVDGEMFSWYGYRSLLAPGYFTELQESL